MIEYSPLDYIKIDIANQYGLDKIQFEDRISWVDEHIKELPSKTKEADKPTQYVAAVQCLRDAINGKPSGHLIGLDACASGIAIMGVIYGCPITCSNTGVTGDKRKDFYQIITTYLNDELSGDLIIPRAQAKDATMTAFYGSSAKPKEIFGKGTVELDAFYTAIQKAAPGACEVMEVLLDSWQSTDYHSWYLPDAFEVKKPTIVQDIGYIEIDELDHLTLKYTYDKIEGQNFGLAIAADVIHSIDGFIVREVLRRCYYGDEIQRYLDLPYSSSTGPKFKKHSFLSLASIETVQTRTKELDDLVAQVNSYPSFPVLTIHDEFKCLANNVSRMRYWYKEILAELAESNILEVILSTINGEEVIVDKLADLSEQIRQGNYHLS